MEKKLLENVGTLMVPQYNAESMLFGDALVQTGVTASRKFEKLFFQERFGYYEERELACRQVVADSINRFNQINWFQFPPLRYPYILSLLRLENDFGLRDKGSHNIVLVDKSLSLYYVDIFKSRQNGWKIDVVDEVKLIYGERIFSGLYR